MCSTRLGSSLLFIVNKVNYEIFIVLERHWPRVDTEWQILIFKISFVASFEILNNEYIKVVPTTFIVFIITRVLYVTFSNFINNAFVIEFETRLKIYYTMCTVNIHLSIFNKKLVYDVNSHLDRTSIDTPIEYWSSNVTNCLMFPTSCIFCIYFYICFKLDWI